METNKNVKCYANTSTAYKSDDGDPLKNTNTPNFKATHNELRSIVLKEFLHRGGLNTFLDEEERHIFDFAYDDTGDYSEVFKEEKLQNYLSTKPFPPDEESDTDDLPNTNLNIIYPKHMAYTKDDCKLHPEYDDKNTFNNIYHVGYYAIANGIISCGTDTGVIHTRLAFKALISAKQQYNPIPFLYDVALYTKYLRKLRVVRCPKNRCKIELYLLTLSSRILYKLRFPRITPLLANNLQWKAFIIALPIIINRMLWRLLWNHVRKFDFTWRIDYAQAREALVALVIEKLTGKKDDTPFGRLF